MGRCMGMGMGMCMWEPQHVTHAPRVPSRTEIGKLHIAGLGKQDVVGLCSECEYDT